MVGDEMGFTALLQYHIGIDRRLIKLYRIIQHEELCANSLNLKDIMAVVDDTVNLVMPKGLSLDQFYDIFKQIELSMTTLTLHIFPTLNDLAARRCMCNK